VDLLDIVDLVKKKKSLILINALYVIREFGLKPFLNPEEAKVCFWNTTYIFRKVKELMSELISEDHHVFSFQIQSMFDTSKPGVPHYVYTDHTHLTNLTYPDFDRRQLLSPRRINMEKDIYHNAVLNFTRSTNISRSIVEEYGCPPEKVICVYAGSCAGSEFTIDVAKYSSQTILFVGTEWERKGGPELVAAFKKVREVIPEARLLVVGCTSDVNVENCDIIGGVALAEVNNYYEKAAVFCLPTRLEPFGVVFLEAFAHALPVVATDIGAIPDFVIDGKTGYKVEPGKTQELSEVLIGLLRDPQKCKDLGEKGKGLVREKYNWDKVGAVLAANIRATLSQTSGIRSDAHTSSFHSEPE
jgi:glycosyltransferase involved in cell wall biosynthesis